MDVTGAMETAKYQMTLPFFDYRDTDQAKTVYGFIK